MEVSPKDSINIYSLTNSAAQLIQSFEGTGLHCGFPSPALDYIREMIDINSWLIKRPSSTFIAQVLGESMIGAFISNPAHLLIDRGEKLRNRDLVVAIVNQEFMVRRYIKQRNTGNILLEPANPKYSDTLIEEGMEFEIWGIVTRILIDPRSVEYNARIN